MSTPPRIRAPMPEGPTDYLPGGGKPPISVTAIHLYRTGVYLVVAVELEGRRNEWIEVIREYDGDWTEPGPPISHIVEAAGIRVAASK